MKGSRSSQPLRCSTSCISLAMVLALIAVACAQGVAVHINGPKELGGADVLVDGRIVGQLAAVQENQGATPESTNTIEGAGAIIHVSSGAHELRIEKPGLKPIVRMLRYEERGKDYISIEADDLSPSAEEAFHDGARAAILSAVLPELAGYPVCLAVRSKVLTDAAPLAATDYEAVLADVVGGFEDPSARLSQLLSGQEFVPMSQCPEPDYPRDSWHVEIGPLRVVRAGTAQLVVVVNMDGFPTWSLCEARLRAEGQWVFQGCTIVAQA